MISPLEFDLKFANATEVDDLLEKFTERDIDGLVALVLGSCVETQWMVGGSVNGPSLRDPWWRDQVVQREDVIRRVREYCEERNLDDPNDIWMLRGLRKAIPSAGVDAETCGLSHVMWFSSTDLETLVKKSWDGDTDFAEGCLQILEDRGEKAHRRTAPGWVVRPVVVDGERSGFWDMEWVGAKKGRLTMSSAWSVMKAREAERSVPPLEDDQEWCPTDVLERWLNGI